MFSPAARARLLERGWSVPSLLAYFRESAAQTRSEMRLRAGPVRSMVRFAAGFYVATVALSALWAGGAFVPMATFAALGAAVFTAWACAWVGLLRNTAGEPVDAIGAANYLTLARFYLIAPAIVLFVEGRPAAALCVYGVLALTDVADGVVARARDERTEFGVVFDPLADVFSTAAMFTAFLAAGLVPAWLVAILYARYLMLFVGSFILFLAAGPIRFRSTPAGKVVGVVQASGIVVLVVGVMSGGQWLARVEPVLFPLLGAGFVAVIVSQLVIGLRHLHRGTAAGEVDLGS